MVETTVGVVGLGKMGGNMAKCLVDSGFQVYGSDVQPDAREAFEAYGGTVAESPQAVAEQSDVTVTSLPTSEIVEDVYLGDGGMVTESIETVFLEMSTIAPPTTETLAEAIELSPSSILDAPITGSPADSREGTLTALVGGEQPVFESDSPQAVLDALAKEIHYAGDSGAGHAMKLLNNTMSMGNLVLAMETVTLGAKYGIEAEKLWSILGNASATSVAFESRMPRVLDRDFEAGFTIDFAKKDIGLAMEMADAKEYPLFLGSLVHRMYTRASDEGYGQEDVGAVVKMFEEQTGTTVGESTE